MKIRILSLYLLTIFAINTQAQEPWQVDLFPKSEWPFENAAVPTEATEFPLILNSGTEPIGSGLSGVPSSSPAHFSCGTIKNETSADETFRASAESFDAKNALFFARLSCLVYFSPNDLQSLEDYRLGLSKPLLVTSTNSYAYVISGTNSIIITIRGTDIKSAKNIYSDVLAIPRSYLSSEGKVHAGFARAETSLATPLMATLANMNWQQKEIWISGHSLGGAIAQLIALRLKSTSPSTIIKGIYTYGAPKVFDSTLAAKMSQIAVTQFNVVNESDLVPRLPPSLPFKFHRSGQDIFLDSNSDAYANLPKLNDPQNVVSDSKNHFISSYVVKLEQLARTHLKTPPLIGKNVVFYTKKYWQGFNWRAPIGISYLRQGEENLQIKSAQLPENTYAVICFDEAKTTCNILKPGNYENLNFDSAPLTIEVVRK